MSDSETVRQSMLLFIVERNVITWYYNQNRLTLNLLNYCSLFIST